MSDGHICLHEEQLLGQSRKLERVDAELNYKKERLDEIKEDNRRMEDKIDKLGEKFDDFINKSNESDTELDKRLTAIETRQDEQEKITTNNRQEFNRKISLGGFVLAVLMFVLTFIRGG